MKIGESSSRKSLSELLGLLRAIRFHYQTAHWNVYGETFLSDHEMFQSFYESTFEEIDILAEKIVRMYGPANITSIGEQRTEVNGSLSDFESIECPFSRIVQMEKQLQTTLEETYQTLDTEGNLTMGMDDFIMSVSNTHEEHIYKLKQRLRK